MKIKVLKRPAYIEDDPEFLVIQTIDGEFWVKSEYINLHYGITTDRIKKWREGRGQASKHNLKTIKITTRLYLYNLTDIETLIELTKGSEGLAL